MQKIQFKTNGKGLWSSVKTSVTIVDMIVDQMSCDYDEGDIDFPDFGELKVVFDLDTWNTDTDGLIYTDPQFIKELRAFLDSHGLPGKDVCYSEQGMQGGNYVSLDVGAKFMRAWSDKFNVEWD